MFDLNPRKVLFCQEYLITNNGTQAAIKAGYSENGAPVRASNMLKDLSVQLYIEELRSQRVERLKVTGDRVIIEMARLGLSDIRKLYNAKGQLKSPADLDDEIAAAVQSVEVVSKTSGHGEDIDVEYTHKVKLAPKLPALAKVGETLQLFNEHQQAGAMNVIIQGKDADL